MNDPLCDTEPNTGRKVIYCPFGCPLDDLDEYGHCKHLVGHTNVQTVPLNRALNASDLSHVTAAIYEPIACFERMNFATNMPFDTGYKVTRGDQRKRTGTVKCSLAIQPGDWLVNPQEWQEGHRIVPHWANKWLSSRVYRPTANTPLADRPAVGEEDSDETADRLECLRRNTKASQPEAVAGEPNQTDMLLRQILAGQHVINDRLDALEAKEDDAVEPEEDETLLPAE